MLVCITFYERKKDNFLKKNLIFILIFFRYSKELLVFILQKYLDKLKTFFNRELKPPIDSKYACYLETPRICYMYIIISERKRK